MKPNPESPHMSHATFRDLIHHFDAEPVGTASASVRYTLDADTARRFKLRRSNSAAFRAGTKARRMPSK